MFYKYKKYKKKYIDFKNQIGGDCIISPDDSETDLFDLEKFSARPIKDALTNIDRFDTKCFAITTVASSLFGKVMKPRDENPMTFFPNIPFTHPYTRTPIDINQIWYIIVNNNNYIFKLRMMDFKTSNYLLHSTIEGLETTQSVFFYTGILKTYIESWLMIFKNKLYVTSLSNISDAVFLTKLDVLYSSYTGEELQRLQLLLNNIDALNHLTEEEKTEVLVEYNKRNSNNSNENKNLDLYLIKLHINNVILEIERTIKMYSNSPYYVENTFKNTDDVKNIRHDTEFTMPNSIEQLEKSTEFRKLKNEELKKHIFSITNMKEYLEQLITITDSTHWGDSDPDDIYHTNIRNVIKYINDILTNKDIYRSNARLKYLKLAELDIWKKIEDDTIFNNKSLDAMKSANKVAIHEFETRKILKSEKIWDWEPSSEKYIYPLRKVEQKDSHTMTKKLEEEKFFKEYSADVSPVLINPREARRLKTIETSTKNTATKENKKNDSDEATRKWNLPENEEVTKAYTRLKTLLDKMAKVGTYGAKNRRQASNIQNEIKTLLTNITYSNEYRDKLNDKYSATCKYIHDIINKCNLPRETNR